MSELTKAEQKRQAREEELIDLALEITTKEGFGALTMEKLTARSSYSKGTIYNHFTNKEDCLSAITARAGNKLLRLFSKAAAYPGSLREKALASHYSYYIFSLIEPQLFMALLATKTQEVREKSSEERMCLCNQLDTSITDLCEQTMRMAVEAGDLKLRDSISFESLSFANWAGAFGMNALIASVQAVAIEKMQKDDLIFNSINILLDGMNFHPLSDQYNYKNTWQTLREDYFAEELQTINNEAIS